MSSWWRKIAELQGATTGTGSWKRLAALGAGATGSGSSWPRITATSLGTQQDTGSWTRRLTPTGVQASSWARALYEAGGLFDPRSIILFAAMDVQPSAQRKTAIDTFIKALVSAGVWDLLDDMEIHRAHTQQAALLNWINPGTYDGITINSPTFTVDQGFAGNGTTSYIDNGFNPTTAVAPHFTQDNCCMGIWVNTERAGADKVVMGQTTGTGVNIYPRYVDGKAYLRLNDAVEAEGFTVASSAGLFVANRSSSTARQGYHNGVSLGVYAANISQVENNDMIKVGRGGTGFSDDEFSMMVVGGSLDATKQAALYAAANAYMQAVP